MSQEQDEGAVPSTSTINTSAMLIAWFRYIVFGCVYDGGDTGSTGLLRVKEITGKERPSIMWGDSRYCPKTIIANDNFASEELRLAA